MPPSPSANRFFDAHTFNSVPCFRPFVIDSYVKWNHRFGFNEERPATDDEEPSGDQKRKARNAPSGEALMAPGEDTAHKAKKARGGRNDGGDADDGDAEDDDGIERDDAVDGPPSLRGALRHHPARPRPLPARHPLAWGARRHSM